MGVVVREQEQTMDKKIALLAQVFMTCIMAATMSGIMSLIALGPSQEWLAGWPLQFAIAWPIAFALTMVAWPASMKLAFAVRRTGPDASGGEGARGTA